MTQDEETIRRIKHLEDLWEMKTNEVKRLLKMRNGDSFRNRISFLKQQITEIEEKLFKFPRIPITLEQMRQASGDSKENENP